MQRIQTRSFFYPYFLAFGLVSCSLNSHYLFKLIQFQRSLDSSTINQFALQHSQVLIDPHMFSSQVRHKRDVTCLGNLCQWRQNRGKKLGAQIANTCIINPRFFSLVKLETISPAAHFLDYVHVGISQTIAAIISGISNFLLENDL